MDSKTNKALYFMLLLTMCLGIGALVLFHLYKSHNAHSIFTLAITFLTFFYHISMRLIVGEIVTIVYRNKAFPLDRLGFRIYSFEEGLYRKLNVKKWKGRVISAKPEQFDLRLVAPDELLHNVLQAELVHRIIMFLSFLPIFLIIPFGSPWVFIITSIMACLIDSIFVIIQRYNRQKVERYIALAKKRDNN